MCSTKNSLCISPWDGMGPLLLASTPSALATRDCATHSNRLRAPTMGRSARPKGSRSTVPRPSAASSCNKQRSSRTLFFHKKQMAERAALQIWHSRTRLFESFKTMCGIRADLHASASASITAMDLTKYVAILRLLAEGKPASRIALPALSLALFCNFPLHLLCALPTTGSGRAPWNPLPAHAEIPNTGSRRDSTHLTPSETRP